MLVEINLLPQKEPRKFNILYLSVIAALLILISGVYGWQVYSTKSDVASLDQQIANTQKIADATEKNASQNRTSNSASLLKAAVDWAKDYPIQTIPVMNHLTSLLPERGFIQSFAYTETGTVTISVQFDNAREAAYFLENLKDSDWIEDVSLTSLTATETASTNNATQTTGQTTGTASTGQTTASTTTTAAAAPSTNTAGQTSATGQTSTTGATTTTTNTTNTGVVANGTTTTATTQPANNNTVPRYVGQFEIKFNKDAIKKSTDDSKKTEEGVTAS